MTWAAIAVGGASAVAGYFASTANSGGDVVSATTVNDWRTPEQGADASRLWNEFIDDFYGTTAQPVSTTEFGFLDTSKIPEEFAAFEEAYQRDRLSLQEQYGKIPSVEEYFSRGDNEGLWPNLLNAVAQRPDLNYWAVDSITLDDLYTEPTDDSDALVSYLSELGGWSPEVTADYAARFATVPDSTIDTASTTGTAGTETSKSYEDRLAEDLAYLKDAEATYKDALDSLGSKYLTDTQTAVDPYQQQLADVLNQLQTGTGLGTPVSFGFGGKEMASFVPKQNMALATQELDIGEEAASYNTSLVDLANLLSSEAATRDYGFSAAHTPNEVANAWSKVLEELMWKMNTGASTESTTGTLPSTSEWQGILAGFSAGTNAYFKLPTTSTPTTTTGTGTASWPNTSLFPNTTT